ncbi:MAG: tetratricopeptide repeat protein [Chloroflexi bacterium]|nr:tetratricopeptide repeat protein [Chloroflexota bacterium]
MKHGLLLFFLLLVFVPVPGCAGKQPAEQPAPMPSPEDKSSYYIQAEKYIREINEKDPPSVAVVIQEAQWDTRKKDFENAQMRLLRAMRQKEDPSLRLELAGLLYRYGRYEQAAGEFAAVLSETPADHKALTGLAASRYASGKTGEALSLLDRAASIDPGWPEPHIMRGDIFFDNNSYGESLLEYSYALNIDPENKDLLFKVYHICLVLHDVDRKNARQLLDAEPDNESAAFISELLSAGDEPARVRETLTSANGKISKKLAKNLTADLEKTLSGSDPLPGNEILTLLRSQAVYSEPSRFTLAKILFMSRDFPSAEREIKLLIKKVAQQEHPAMVDTLQPYIWLARVYMMQGRYEESAALLGRVNKELVRNIGKGPDEDVRDLFGMITATFPYNSDEAPGKNESRPSFEDWKIEGFDRIPLEKEVPGLASRIRKSHYLLERGDLNGAASILDGIIKSIDRNPPVQGNEKGGRKTNEKAQGSVKRHE